MDILFNQLVLSLEYQRRFDIKRHSRILLKILKSKLNSKYIAYNILELYLMQYIKMMKKNEVIIIQNNLTKYLWFTKSIWDKNSCACAASNGQLECLKYLHENGCPWGVWTCQARYSNLECLNYARENGCPWFMYIRQSMIK